jgi:hypothetical protein
MSILGDIFKIAAGVAIGNKVSRGRENDGSGRQNLFGTAACRYGQKDERSRLSYATVACNMTCPVHSHCTQRGMYKVGS